MSAAEVKAKSYEFQRAEPTGMDNGAVAWRSLYVANELNEIQTELRRIYPATTLIWFTAFHVGLGFQWFAQSNPDFIGVNNPLEPFNDVLKFFLAAFMILVIALAQLILYWLRVKIDINPAQAFVDVCVMANCSVLICTDVFKGYYIHGKAVWKKSDLPLSWLKIELDWEAENMHPSRAISREKILKAAGG